MKEILFRCYDEANNEMLDVAQLKFEFGEVFIRPTKYNEWFTTNEMPLMQWTSEYDKEHKKVFEGDIILDYFGNKFIVQDTHSCTLLGSTTGQLYSLKNVLLAKGEVISNIYDNEFSYLKE